MLSAMAVPPSIMPMHSPLLPHPVPLLVAATPTHCSSAMLMPAPMPALPPSGSPTPLVPPPLLFHHAHDRPDDVDVVKRNGGGTSSVVAAEILGNVDGGMTMAEGVGAERAWRWV